MTEWEDMRARHIRRVIEGGPPPVPREIIKDLGMGDPDDLRMVETRWASEQRRPCRRGEYIVISLDGLNTLIVVNTANADNALLWRLQQITDPQNRNGRWLVTNGKVTALYDVQGAVVERPHATWLGDYEHE